MRLLVGGNECGGTSGHDAQHAESDVDSGNDGRCGSGGRFVPGLDGG